MKEKKDNTELKDLRKFLKMSQEAFARALGLSTEAIRKWEQGRSKPSALALERINKLVQKTKREQLKNA